MSWVGEVVRRRRIRQALGRIAVALALVTPCALYVGWPHWQEYRQRQEAQANAVALDEYAPAVFPAVSALLGYDYRDFDGAVARGQSFLTGPFAAEYTATMASMRGTVLAEQAVVTAKASGVSLSERGQRRAEVMAYVIQERRSNRLAGVEFTQCLVVINLERVGSSWKVARFVIQPNARVRVSPTAAP